MPMIPFKCVIIVRVDLFSVTCTDLYSSITEYNQSIFTARTDRHTHTHRQTTVPCPRKSVGEVNYIVVTDPYLCPIVPTGLQ